MIDYSQSDFIAWQAERERLYAEIKRRTDDSDRMAQVAIDNARESERLREENERLREQNSYFKQISFAFRYGDRNNSKGTD